MSGSNLWEEILSGLETRINRHIFFTWFKAIRFEFEDDEVLQVRVPSALFRDWFLIRYAPAISDPRP